MTGGLQRATVDPAAVAANLAVLRYRIEAAGGSPDAVRIVAVTKTFPLEAVRATLAAGLTDIGENYADELVDKAEMLEQVPGAPERLIRWHFLGSIQRNKLGRLAPHVASYDGVDRLSEGESIARRHPGASVLVEIDTTGTETRGGVTPNDAPALVSALQRLELRVEGLMTVAPPDPSGAARAFELVGALRLDLGLVEASMGMSGDLELAVQAGSTMIRVGTALFGPRELSSAVSQ